MMLNLPQDIAAALAAEAALAALKPSASCPSLIVAGAARAARSAGSPA